MDLDIDNKFFYKRLFAIALPIAFQNLMHALVAACDALMLGRIDQNEMTAVSLATQVQFVLGVLLFAVTSAGVILGAQYWGKRDIKAIEKIYSIMLFTGVTASFTFFVMCEFFSIPLMHVFSSDRIIMETGAAYLRIAGWSYFISGISCCSLAIMKITDNVTPSAVISSSAVVINIVLNSVFIFGLLGFPAMRARGAALATTLSRIIELMLCIIVTVRRKLVLPRWDGFTRRNRELIRDFFRQCAPLAGGSTMWAVGFAAYTAIIGHIGTDAAAANSVSSVIRDLVCCVCNGIGNAAGIIVGNELGAGRLDRGKAYGIKLKNLSYLIGVGSMLAVLAVTPFVCDFVKLTGEARGYLTGMMIIMAVYMIGRSVNTVAINGILDGGGDTVFDVYSLAVCMWGVAIPLAYFGAFFFHFPVLLVYACTCLDEVGKIPWVMLRIRKYKWVRDLTR